jgi:hypothetical protein
MSASRSLRRRRRSPSAAVRAHQDSARFATGDRNSCALLVPASLDEALIFGLVGMASGTSEDFRDARLAFFPLVVRIRTHAEQGRPSQHSFESMFPRRFATIKLGKVLAHVPPQKATECRASHRPDGTRKGAPHDCAPHFRNIRWAAEDWQPLPESAQGLQHYRCQRCSPDGTALADSRVRARHSKARYVRVTH